MASDSQPTDDDDNDILLTLASFTDPSLAWIPQPPLTTTQRATALLNTLFLNSNKKKQQFIVEGILRQYLRPLFSKTKPPASITASGRKAEFTDPVAGRGEGIPDESSKTKPWKYNDFRAVPVFAWAVDEADVRGLPSCFRFPQFGFTVNPVSYYHACYGDRLRRANIRQRTSSSASTGLCSYRCF